MRKKIFLNGLAVVVYLLMLSPQSTLAQGFYEDQLDYVAPLIKNSIPSYTWSPMLQSGTCAGFCASDGVFCNGVEYCVDICRSLGNPCEDDNICTLDICDENNEQCLPKVCDSSIITSPAHSCCADPFCIGSPECNYCKGDFDVDQDVDADDVTAFVADFGREEFFYPCGDPIWGPCDGDFDCDVDVDADDVTVFVANFGREEFYNPCPASIPGDWCNYDSCMGNCGGRAPGECYCDSDCEGYGDCCPDKIEVCGHSSYYCEGHCGGEAPFGCYCDQNCAVWGACCPDACSECGYGCP